VGVVDSVAFVARRAMLALIKLLFFLCHAFTFWFVVVWSRRGRE
jgi:hypothetical protein